MGCYRYLVDIRAYKQLRRVEDVHWWYRAARHQVASLIDQFWPSRPPEARVLDAGCGTGGTTSWLRKYGTVFAVDLQCQAVQATRDRGIPAVLASTDALPFRDGVFDMVTSFDVIYHARVNNPQSTLEELCRVTVDGGRLLVRVPAFNVLDGPHDRFVHGVRRFRVGELVTALTASGWHKCWAGYVNAFMFLPALLVRRLPARSFEGDLDRSASFGSLLYAIQWVETRLLGKIRLPFGTSLLAFVDKPPRRHHFD